jgi:hypothetical protein
VITLKAQTDDAWDNGTTHVVTAPLTPPLTPSQIGRIVITLTSHNSLTETDDNWNVQSVNVYLNNLPDNGGAGSQALMSVSGAPFARLTGTVPSLVLPPAGLGMTMPVDPDSSVGAERLFSASGDPLQRLTGSVPSLTLTPLNTIVPPSFNQIRFVIATGDDDLRGDSSATATLQSPAGSPLQVITLKWQTDDAWDNGTTHVVTAPLTPPLTPSQIGRIVITLTSHNSPTETDDNWNVQSVDVWFSTNNAIELPLPINKSLGPGVLPYGYQIAFSDLVDGSNSSLITGSCSAAMACLPQWNGTVNEQDGRLDDFLRANAASQDAKLLLLRSVWFALGLSPGGSISCGGGHFSECAGALAELAVTGRQAFNTFVSWNPTFAPASSGPQVSDLMQLAQQGYKDVPAIPTGSVSNAGLEVVCTNVLGLAYETLWAIRSNDPAWRQWRLTGRGPVVVSGEDDTPHRPVNVPTAPFPQFDIPVPVTVGGNEFTLTTRYMIAAAQTQIPLNPTANRTQPPPIPTIPPGGGARARLTIPSDNPSDLLNGTLKNKNVIIYIHGGGSRLEEAVPMATQFVTKFGPWSDNLVVISFDLPNSAYDDTMLVPVAGTPGQPVALDASSAAFEGGSNGTAPTNVLSYPVLNFTINFINNFINTLGQQGIINPKQVLAVMGGSLGGNTSLLLSMDPMPPPFHLENPLAFSAPQSAPGGGQPTFVAWSPTSMIAPSVASVIIGQSMCCLVGGAGPTWQPEVNTTRRDYFYHLYYSGTAPGLPPDPDMWYRNDWWWTDATQTINAATSFITGSRFDRYEIYSSLARLWTTAIDTEQAIFSFQTNTNTAGLLATDQPPYRPYYQFISARILLAAGACDDYDNGGSTAAFAPPPSISTGVCDGHGLGNTGRNNLVHVDIYGYTHDVANDMRNAAGKTLFINDTGHSIHDERPVFFTQQIFDFLNNPDNNINLTLLTGGDDLRWNSEAHVIVGLASGNSLDFPLNYWFHPWPIRAPWPIAGNPCGECYNLTSFHFPSGNPGASASDNPLATVNNFTIALPSTVSASQINSFNIEFIAGTASMLNTTDEWKVAAVAACLQGSKGGFISDGFPVRGGMVQDFNPSSENQAVLWQPPSFQSAAISVQQNNCNAMSTNPPPNNDVATSLWNNGVHLPN